MFNDLGAGVSLWGISSSSALASSPGGCRAQQAVPATTVTRPGFPLPVSTRTGSARMIRLRRTGSLRVSLNSSRDPPTTGFRGHDEAWPSEHRHGLCRHDTRRCSPPEAYPESEGVPQFFPSSLSPKIEDPPQEEWGPRGLTRVPQRLPTGSPPVRAPITLMLYLSPGFAARGTSSTTTT